ncbi:MAG TPA: hypothetical protein VK066_07950 [Chloroflexota bacterium]|nr:hypothetical protein [Chloroflexota bacterium]
MALRLSHLAADRRTVQVPVGDEQLTVTYRPSGYTPLVEEEVAAKRDDDRRPAGPIVALLAGVLDAWDLQDDRGKPVPTTAESLRTLPTRFLGQVLTAIVEDMSPGEAGAPSAAG